MLPNGQRHILACEFRRPPPGETIGVLTSRRNALGGHPECALDSNGDIVRSPAGGACGMTASYLAQRGVRRNYRRDALPHRLKDRQAEALITRGEEHGTCVLHQVSETSRVQEGIKDSVLHDAEAHGSSRENVTLMCIQPNDMETWQRPMGTPPQ
jgi:hypothetical protein